MSGVDHLLAKSLDDTIRKNLGSKTVKKVEDRLFEKFGISLTQGMEDFNKVDLVLREFFGKGADGLEIKFFENIFQSKSKKSKYNWYTISDPHVTALILQSFGDEDQKKIMESISEKPKIVAEILNECNLPQTSGYRKINDLIDNGMVYVADQITKDNKKINKYVCAFHNVKINIINNKMTIDVQLTDKEQKESSILQTIKI